MSKEQWAVKVEEDLFSLLEKLKYEKNFKSRDELLEFLANEFVKQTKLQIDEQLDLSQYDEIEEEAKKSIKDGFELIITSIKQYNKKTKLQASKLEEHKLTLDEERAKLEDKIKDIQLSHNEEIKKLNQEYRTNLKLKDDELLAIKNDLNREKVENLSIKKSFESLEKEMANLRSIAENTKVVIEENKDLKNTIKDLNQSQNNILEKFEFEKSNIKNFHNEEIKTLKLEIKEYQDKYLNTLTEKNELLNFNNFNKQEIASLKKEIQRLEDSHQQESIKLKENEKQNIILQTKLDMLMKK